MQKLKAGVVGVGNLGRHHLRVYTEIPEVETIGVYDVNREQAEIEASKYGVKVFDSIEELGDQTDLVSIVVPTVEHFNVASILLEKGVHVLVEKPFTIHLNEAETLIRSAETQNRILQVGHIEQFNSGLLQARTYIHNPKYIECQRLGPYTPRVKDIGVVMDLMIHDLEIVLSLVNSPIERIDAVGIKVMSSHEDMANCHIVFANGTIANLNASRLTQEKMRKIRIFQEDSYISLDYANQEFQYKTLKSQEEKREIVESLVSPEKKEPLRLELEHFVNCVKNHSQPLVSGNEGKNALQIALQILEKLRG